MSNPIEDLGKIMDSQMKRVMNANNGITVELGIIKPTMALHVDSLVNDIPAGEYMISLHLQDVPLTINTTTESLEMSEISLTTEKEEEHTHTIKPHQHSISGHKHSVTLPTKLRGLQAGDRVLVLWAGTEPVVVDIVISS